MVLPPHTRHAAAFGADGVRCTEASRQHINDALEVLRQLQAEQTA
jgi:hypothetical protein